MKAMQRKVNERYMITASLVFFLIHSMQIGIGILSYQQDIVKSAGNDSWIAVIFAGLIVHIIIWMMYKILKNGKGDLITIHYDLFGKWLGGIFSLIWIIYYWAIGLVVIRSYLEVVQVWMFPDISIWQFSLIFLSLVYYLLIGGFRVVTGICFLGVVIPAYLLLTLIFPIEFTEFRNLLPIWNHSLKDISLATKDMTLSYLGLSTLLMFYPYLKNPERSQKWAHGGNLLTMLLYAGLMILSIAYFGQGYLSRIIWPTLTMWKIVELPFVERFEYVGISSWALIILPNICLSFWAASRGVRQLLRFSQRKALIGMLLMTWIIIYFLQERQQIEMLSSYVSMTGFYLIVIYLPLLFVFSYLRLLRR
ncbi:GerAB/ArcD/ProY family transporter [Gracilibacillus sp. YIM 98692]|uniref:GerAB/ArcD/ProY family transporter n=1 Tax=Gracilibacillus sp. YIM 98692 TaxID=2663532 RepID=UPI001F08FEAA|nr:GerAB/ArcD/ProY family transporter [Gracilibacillus sp. YIM 98692]